MMRQNTRSSRLHRGRVNHDFVDQREGRERQTQRHGIAEEYQVVQTQNEEVVDNVEETSEDVSPPGLIEASSMSSGNSSLSSAVPVGGGNALQEAYWQSMVDQGGVANTTMIKSRVE